MYSLFLICIHVIDPPCLIASLFWLVEMQLGLLAVMVLHKHEYINVCDVSVSISFVFEIILEKKTAMYKVRGNKYFYHK